MSDASSQHPPGHRLTGTVLLVVGAALTAASSAIHLHLWMNGYRHIPTIGPLFMAQVIAGFALALVVAATRRPLVGAAAFIFVASTMGGFLLSVWIGLFGFRDSWSAPYAVMAFALEASALAALAAGVALTVHHRLGHYAPGNRSGGHRSAHHPSPAPG